MRVSIIAQDNAIMIDGKYMICDCSALLKEHISAVQWYGDRGEVEFIKHVKPNEPIDDLSPFTAYIDAAKPPPEPEPMSLEEHKAFQEKWLADHPEWVKKQQEYEQANRQKMEAMSPEELARQQYEWQQANPDLVKQQQEHIERFQAELKRLNESG